MAQNVLVHGVRYNGISKLELPRANGEGNAKFYDTASATATTSDILETKTAYGPDGVVAGTIRNVGPINGIIDSVDDRVEIAEGFTTGGSIGLNPTEQAKLLPSNIRAGVNILGVDGAPTVIETSTESGAISNDIVEGKQAFVNGESVVGTRKVVSLSQDPVTKFLIITTA